MVVGDGVGPEGNEVNKGGVPLSCIFFHFYGH